ncbi:hypothetical protein [Flavobacterium sp.]|uniref:hypothetical protein n=1 Tax=Flavobacterium sp. TaxID=239 RepID=UPI002ED0223D
MKIGVGFILIKVSIIFKFIKRGRWKIERKDIIIQQNGILLSNGLSQMLSLFFAISLI